MSNIRGCIEVLNRFDKIAKRQNWESEMIKSYESTSRKYTGEDLKQHSIQL